jgi:hypothetical protein
MLTQFQKVGTVFIFDFLKSKSNFCEALADQRRKSRLKPLASVRVPLDRGKYIPKQLVPFLSIISINNYIYNETKKI